MTRTYDPNEVAVLLAKRWAPELFRLRAAAAATPWEGRTPITATHRMMVPAWGQPDMSVSMILTFDMGPHAVGWWKNSQYDRCWHLSLVAIHKVHGYVELPKVDRLAWGRVFFMQHLAKTWTEPPAGEGDEYRDAPASRYTTHIRLFVDRAHGEPIIPKGEVYTLIPWAEGDSPEKVFR